MRYFGLEQCGCWVPVSNPYQGTIKQHLPQLGLKSHTTILATTSRTVLSQTFVNSTNDKLEEVHYTFPLYDGVSVVGFKCTVASKTITGIVKEKQQARTEYKEAVARGETAGLLEQLAEASDVFTTKIGNIPANEQIYVEIIYLGELKHDAEAEGARFAIPTAISPRYGHTSQESAAKFTTNVQNEDGINIIVDIVIEESSVIRGVQSPTHPISVTMGRTTTMNADAFDNNHASATLSLGSATLKKDFVLIVQAKGQDTPRALLESHPTIPNQRALMATLVPKFNIPNIIPEIVFVADRSGSMEGNIPTLVDAMKVFLKSLPVSGVKFNICSFGSSHSFLFKKSKTYDESSLQEALAHLKSFGADYGGTEMLQPIKATVKNRYKDMPLEVMLLTDGEIWQQQEVFDYINKQKNARFFTLGIGAGASSALVEGIARAGNGFAQFVADGERMDKKLVRMLKGALTPHITDYSLEVHYGKPGVDDMADDGFEIVESFNASTATLVTDLNKAATDSKKSEPIQKIISLFDTSAKEEAPNPPANRYEGLPQIDTPKILQAPHNMPPLYPFNRTTVYLLLGPNSCQKTPTSVVLKGTSEHGPLQLEIPVQDVGKGQTIHQLAAKKAVHELEQGRGWIAEAKADGKLIKSIYEGRWDLIVEREAVHLGVEFQIGGKFCSFVAVERKNPNRNESEGEKNEGAETEWIIDDNDDAEPGNQNLPSPSVKKKSTGLFARQRRSTGFMARSAPPPPAAAAASLFGSTAPQQSQGAPAVNSFLRSLSVDLSAEPGVSTSSVRRSVPGVFGDGGGAAFSCSAEGFGAPMGARKPSAPVPPPPPAPFLDRMEEEEESSSMDDEEIVDFSSTEHDTSQQLQQQQQLQEPQRLRQQDLTDEDKMHKLIEMQAFNGTWDGKDGELWKLINLNPSDSARVEGLMAMTNNDMKVVATLVAVTWLENKMHKEEEVWEMVVEKARTWLSGQNVENIDELLKKARMLFR